MVITSCPLPQNEAERLNTLVSLQPEFTPLDGQFSAGANTVTIPPLRDRKPDIPLLVASMLEKYAPRYHKTIKGLTDRAMQALMSYDWPGNIRELENLIERGVLLAPSGGQIEVDHLFAGGAPGLETSGAEVGREGVVGDVVMADRDRLCETLLGAEGFDLEAHEARLLNLAVQRSGGNLTHAARLLGITRRQLAYRLKQCDGEGKPQSN